MKGIRIRTAVAAIAASAVAVLALAGCTPDPSADMQPSVLSINTETGKITKYVEYTYQYVDSDGSEVEETKEVVFEENFSKKDTEIEYDFGGYNDVQYYSGGLAYELSSSLEVDGTPYPVTTTLDWSGHELDTLEVISYYNEHLASTANVQDFEYGYRSITALVLSNLDRKVQQTLEQAGLPAVQYAVTGRSVTVADERVIAGWQAGTPAWLTLQGMSDTKITSELYSYSFFCATYDVAVVNEQAVLDAVKALPGLEGLSFELSSSKSKLLVETAQPCTIEAYDGGNPATQQGYDTPVPSSSNGGGSGTSTSPDPGGL